MITFFLLAECRNLVFLQGKHFIQVYRTWSMFLNNNFGSHDSFVVISIEEQRVRLPISCVMEFFPTTCARSRYISGKRLFTFFKQQTQRLLFVYYEMEWKNEFNSHDKPNHFIISIGINCDCRTVTITFLPSPLLLSGIHVIWGHARVIRKTFH